MRTGNFYFLNNSSVTILRRRNKRRTPNVDEPELCTIVQVAPMADNRTMDELLQAPTEGYGEAIVIPEVNADHFEIKTNLLQLVQANPYHGFERENPHTHINNFKRIISTLKFRNVPNDVIKLMMFPFSLEESASVPSIPNPKKVVERETEETTDKEQTNFQGSTAHIQPPVTPIPKPDVPKTLPKPNIPYPSRLNNQKLREKATNQMEKFFQIFQDLHFDISFADALLLMLKFASTIKSLHTYKDKLFELAKIPLNENCSAMPLKKLPKKLGDPGKFLIPCDFLRKDVCQALADLGASINLMPLFIWKMLSLPELTPTRMTLELVDQSITRPKGVIEDVFIKVGKLHFLTDFVIVDFKANPRVPLILGRSFLRTGHDLSVNRIDIIDVAREEYAQEIPGFFKNSSSGNPTSTSEPILSDSSPSPTLFEGSDFILEEIEAYLKDESILLEIDHADCDPKGDICLIEKLLNNDPVQLPPMDLKQGEVVKAKSLIEEPPELVLKDLPSHLEYAYLEGVDQLPVIIAKDLKVDEKEALLKVLKSHKRAIVWKITNIKGINPRFCTLKILMKEDYKPAVQSERWVNLKIYEVIKKEVIKLLDAEMIHPISNSPWVSPIHCVPKKGGIIVFKKENNELIPTRLVIGWRVCIDYSKLKVATHKDHSSLPFMDQMLDRLTGNELNCFLDGFFGYFQIPVNPPNQEKTTFTCPYGTFAYRRMSFGLCNAPETFQRWCNVIASTVLKGYLIISTRRHTNTWLIAIGSITIIMSMRSTTSYNPIIRLTSIFPRIRIHPRNIRFVS
nr:reverse transcriptase domain-containing protein [Tanacetum cinerariifolium]